MTDRILVIMRHAKAEQSEAKADVDRTLTDRGQADAHAAGAWLSAKGLAPDVVLCSPAIRTRSTWHQVAVGLTEAGESSAPEVTYQSDLYHGGLASAIDLVRAVEADARIVLLVGHNPTVSALSHRLDDSRIRGAGGLRTSGIAVHRLTTEWSALVNAAMVQEHTARAVSA